MSTALTREQIRELDRCAIEEYGIPGVVLMENAGRNATQEILRFMQPSERRHFNILCGPGNNGGDGFVIARHLHNQEQLVQLVLVGDPQRLSADARVNYQIALNMGLPIEVVDANARLLQHSGAAILVDALLGTGFSGRMRPPMDRVIMGFNEAQAAARIAIDVPSGLDCNTGQAAQPTARVDLTVTFVARKIGFDAPQAAAYTGRVVVADIGAPRELLQRIANGD